MSLAENVNVPLASTLVFQDKDGTFSLYTHTVTSNGQIRRHFKCPANEVIFVHIGSTFGVLMRHDIIPVFLVINPNYKEFFMRMFTPGQVYVEENVIGRKDSSVTIPYHPVLFHWNWTNVLTGTYKVSCFHGTSETEHIVHLQGNNLTIISPGASAVNVDLNDYAKIEPYKSNMLDTLADRIQSRVYGAPKSIFSQTP